MNRDAKRSPAPKLPVPRDFLTNRAKKKPLIPYPRALDYLRRRSGASGGHTEFHGGALARTHTVYHLGSR